MTVSVSSLRQQAEQFYCKDFMWSLFSVEEYSSNSHVINKSVAGKVTRMLCNWDVVNVLYQTLTALWYLKSNWTFPNLCSMTISVAVTLVPEGVVRRCPVKKVFLEILQNSLESRCARDPEVEVVGNMFFNVGSGVREG